MNQEESTRTSCVDFSFQFSAAREFQKVEKKIYNNLIEVSKNCYKTGLKIGCLIVYGYFDLYRDHNVPGMRQIGLNPVQKYLNIAISSFEKDFVSMIKDNQDGSIIVNRDGQILGSKIYLTVDNPVLDVPEGCGTRHITAASFSMRKDVMSVFTLSEETFLVRTWKDGQISEQYNPELEEG
jgi:DNA integrity scanning protein DisA with diadenylate cyclase activity